MSQPAASIANLEKLRSANIVPSKVGQFSLASDRPAAMDTMLSGLRGSSVKPANDTFSQQLKDELIAELKGAGFYDEASDFVIEGQLTDSKVDAAIKQGSAKLAANFTVDKKGTRVFDKELSVESTWESSFVGAIAIPEAINQYTALYKKLIGKLFVDPDFLMHMRTKNNN
jgi:hypothetical protein